MNENAVVFPNRKRLVLGFDAGCVTCSELAREVEARTDDKLEVRPLNDPHVRRWREQVLGENAPWAPTLIEVDGGGVRAWTGPAMSIALGRRLGPVASWRVLRALGEVRSARKEAARSLRTGAAEGLTRGQFLKGVGGAALAASMVAGGLAAAAKPSAAASNTATNPTADQLRVQREFIERSRQTPVGKTFTLVNEDGKKLTFKHTGRSTFEAVGLPSGRGALGLSGERTTSDVCVQLVVGAILAIGAGVIGAAAAAGVSLLIAGILVGPDVLGVLAASLSVGAGLEDLVAAYIC